jgi:cytochrome P450
MLWAKYLTYLAGLIIYNLYFHPLAKFPGPKAFAATPIPYITHQLAGRLPFMYKDLHEQYGDVVRVLPNKLSFNDPAAWRDIYNVRNGHALLTKDPKVVVPSDEGVYNIVTTPNIADHTRYRRTLNPAFSDKAVKEQEPIVAQSVNRLIDKLHEHCGNDERQDLVFWLTLMTFDIISDLTFGESLRGLETETYHPWLQGLFGSAMKHASLRRAMNNFPHVAPLLNQFFMPSSLLAQRVKHANFVKDRVDNRMGFEIEHRDFMSYILPYDEAKTKMTLPEVRATYGVLMMAGSENLATTMEFTLYHVLRNRRCYEALVDEIRRAFRKEDDIYFQSVAGLRYLNAVLNESMRIQPAAPASQPRVVPENGEWIAGHWVPGNVTYTPFSN